MGSKSQQNPSPSPLQGGDQDSLVDSQGSNVPGEATRSSRPKPPPPPPSQEPLAKGPRASRPQPPPRRPNRQEGPLGQLGQGGLADAPFVEDLTRLGAKTRRRQLWRRRIGVGFLFILLIAALLFAILPIFRIQEIQCTDQVYLQEEDLLQASGMKAGDHILHEMDLLHPGRYTKVEERLKTQFPLLGEVHCTLKRPHTLVIQAYEHVPLGYLTFDGYQLVLNEEAKVVAITKTEPPTLPEILGIDVKSALLGKPVIVSNPADLQRILDISTQVIRADLESKDLPPLYPMVEHFTSLSVNRTEIAFTSPSSGKAVKVIAENNPTLRSNLIWLKTVLATQVMEKWFPGTFDLTGKGIIFRTDRVGQYDSSVTK